MNTEDVKTEPAKTPDPNKAEVPAQPKKEERNVYRVLSPIGYGGKDYEPGKTITLTQAEADEMPWALKSLEDEKKEKAAK